MADRRAFLKVVAGVAAALAGLLAAVPSLISFTSPVFGRRSAQGWVRLGAVDRFEPQLPTKVDFPQTVTDAWVESRTVRTVWIYTEDGTDFNVYNPRCPHLGCSYTWVKELY
jgi:menaquinol-cytochrome c reductase iron-sulfur subunit